MALPAFSAVTSFHPRSDHVLCLLALSDGRIASGHRNGDITVWKDFKREQVVHGHAHGVSALFAHDGKVYSAGWDMTVRIWDSKWDCITSFEGKSAFNTIAMHADGTLLTGDENGYLMMWDSEGKPSLAFNSSNRIAALLALPDGRVCVAGSQHNVYLWDKDASVRDPVHYFRVHSPGVTSMALTPRGDVLVAGVDGWVHLWSGKNRGKRLFRQSCAVTCLAVFPDGAVASGSLSRDIKVWNDGKGTRLKNHNYPQSALIIVDGDIISADDGGHIKHYRKKLE